MRTGSSLFVRTQRIDNNGLLRVSVKKTMVNRVDFEN